jgi:hypothetical protein
MAKIPVDISLFVEDARVVLRTPTGSYSISAYPADIHTKDWAAKRQKETNRVNIMAPLELQWSSLGILEFMEVNGEVWSASMRKRQITFYMSILTLDHVSALQAQIERKHSIGMCREQIQPVVLTGFQATIDIELNGVRRLFYGQLKNLDALRPLACVFTFDSQTDMDLILEEIASEEGITLICQVAVGGVRYETATLTIPNKRLVDSNLAATAFGANVDAAFFTSSQLDALAQSIVNLITIPEIGAQGGNLVDMKPLVVTALQAAPVEVTLTPEMMTKVSPLNGEDIVLTEEMNRFAESIGGDLDLDLTTQMPPRSPPAGAKHNRLAPVVAHKKSAKETDTEEKLGRPRTSGLGLPGGIADRRQRGVTKKKLYRVLRSKLSENIILQWPKMNGTAQSCVYSPITIDTRNHICQYVERSFRCVFHPLTVPLLTNN